MITRAASLILLSALCAAVASCAPDKAPKSESNIPPVHFKDEIIDTLKGVFDKNATMSVSNAMIADPVLRPVGGDQHYVSCVRYTAHGAAETVDVERIGFFYGGHLNQLVEATKEQCGNAAYKPFPELNAVCLGRGCK